MNGSSKKLIPRGLRHLLHSPPPSKTISLVHEEQGEGEPLHWSLFVATENEPGMVYQVTGDAELMTYLPSDDPINIVHSVAFLNIYHLAPVTKNRKWW
ncbi:unnamed protein product [Penicillium roqueforti FM164]|uniref:Genomic scaffold, ProqFM164S01 n=1 Tax=Penicillium roqueforti (strain FM164) TaxID=1365484 RepID=W6PVD6_PENRF|nr:unnamed protein product [Penicillium roqueforti FM164]